MVLAVRPQTGPSLVWTVVPAVHDGGAFAATAAVAAVGAAEAPPPAATVSPAPRAAAAATNITARSGCLFPRGDAALILFHLIVNAPETDVRLGSPLGRLPAPMTASPARRPAAAGPSPAGAGHPCRPGRVGAWHRRVERRVLRRRGVSHLLAAQWAVLPAAGREAARIRPHVPGFFPGPSPSAGLYPLLVQGTAGPGHARRSRQWQRGRC